MLTCKQATEIMSQGLDRRLGPGERLRLRLHVLFCRGCARTQRQFAVLRQATRRFADDGDKRKNNSSTL